MTTLHKTLLSGAALAAFLPAMALAQEATTLVQKLSAGLHTLPEVDDVHYGATQKQEVWRDGAIAGERGAPGGDPAGRWHEGRRMVGAFARR